MALKTTVIVGAGIGGMLTGAYLAKHGHRVLIFEKLGIAGGRFTHIDYEGFAVPTGAFHAFPGGKQGPLATCLRDIGISIEIEVPEPSFRLTLKGISFPLDLHGGIGRKTGMGPAFGLRGKVGIAIRLVNILYMACIGKDITVADFIKRNSTSDNAVRLVDHLTKFSLGVPAEYASMVDIIHSFITQSFGREGFLYHGNRSLINALENSIIKNGGIISLSTQITKIRIDGGTAISLTTSDGTEVNSDVVILNSGLTTTLKLLGDWLPEELRKRATQFIPAYGVAYSIRSRQRLLHHSSIEIPVDLDEISGIVPVSEICPALCPPDWHYALAYQYLSPSRSIEDQLNHANVELRYYLGEEIDIFNTAIYKDTHPAAYISQSIGQCGKNRWPYCIPSLNNVYFVGHDVCGHGIAAEIIGDSCLHTWRKLV